MVHVLYFFTSIISLFLSIFTAILPGTMPYKPLKDDIKLNVALISDTHITGYLPAGQAYLFNAFRDIDNSYVQNDALVVSGDITNFGDKTSVENFFKILTLGSSVETKIIAMGNHDIGRIADKNMTNQEAREQFLKYHNEYLGTQYDKNYYSYDVKGYKFIVLCDESEDNMDMFEIYDEQAAFLDGELAEAAERGLPSFVICHEPVVGQNGQAIADLGGCLLPESSDLIISVMEKYDNVFYISGHMHEGINGDYTQEKLGFRNIETVDGVTYISLPSYLLPNLYGYMGNGMGMQMEVYENEIIFRARNYSTSEWFGYEAYQYSVPLV